MYKSRKILLIAPAFNEEGKIGEVVRRAPRDIVDVMLVVDDGSTDGTADAAQRHGAEVISLDRVYGVGYAIRRGFDEARRRGCDIVVAIAGNNKDAPEEIPLLLDPIVDGRADFVQGSRFLKPRASFGAMPLYRRIATRVHPFLFSLAARRWVTESTNGFRAVHRRVLTDARLDLSPTWLDAYELEPFLYLRAIQLGYRTAEVPVTKVYPARHLGQTKMTPIIGWWSILRPLVYAGLRPRR